MDHLPKKCIILILSFLKTNLLIKCKKVCKIWYNIINNEMDKFIIDLSLNKNVTDEILKQFINAENIDVTDCPITDRGLIYLNGAKTINLTGCWNITDKGLSYIKDVKNLNLSDCYNITNVGVSHLTNIEYLDISYCHNITINSICDIISIKSIKNCIIIKINKLISFIFSSFF